MAETAEILSDPAAMAALEEGLGEIQRGETVTLAELRKELAAAKGRERFGGRDTGSGPTPGSVTSPQ